MHFFELAAHWLSEGPQLATAARHCCRCRCLQTRFVSNTQKEREWACTLAQGRWKGGQRNSKKTRARQRARARTRDQPRKESKRAASEREQASKQASKREKERESESTAFRLRLQGSRMNLFFSVLNGFIKNDSP